MTEDDAVKAFAKYILDRRAGRTPKKYPFPLSEKFYIDKDKWPLEETAPGKVRRLIPKAKLKYRELCNGDA